MTAEEKIDLLCSEHMNGLTTVWAVTNCLHDIKRFLIICHENGMISSDVQIDLINHYTMCAGDRINWILEDMDDKKLSEQELQAVRLYLVNNVMRNIDIMHNEDARNYVDLPSVIASLYELLHREVTGESYEYMFHWANKVGSDVNDDIFKEVLDEVPED